MLYIYIYLEMYKINEVIGRLTTMTEAPLRNVIDKASQ